MPPRIPDDRVWKAIDDLTNKVESVRSDVHEELTAWTEKLGALFERSEQRAALQAERVTKLEGDLALVRVEIAAAKAEVSALKSANESARTRWFDSFMRLASGIALAWLLLRLGLSVHAP